LKLNVAIDLRNKKNLDKLHYWARAILSDNRHSGCSRRHWTARSLVSRAVPSTRL